MKTTKKIRFADLPREYTALCRMYLPRPIHDKTEYESASEIAGGFAGFEQKMTTDQTDYFDLICTLLETWETSHLRLPKGTNTEVLRHLLEQQDLTATDLSRILGSSAKLGPMILRGERSITAAHARTLGEHFKVSPAVFL